MDSVEIIQFTALSCDLEHLAIEATREGHRSIERLLDDWHAGANRFDGMGEILLGAYADGQLLAVAGLNKDPYANSDDTGRVRHVYVTSGARRTGIGSLLLNEIIAKARETFVVLRLRTTTDEAAAFYERFGFELTDDENATHTVEFGAR